MGGAREPMRLGEWLLLSALWMLFGFMLWFYLSAFHIVPVRWASGEILAWLLGDPFDGMVAHADRRYLLQVHTHIPFLFPDGSREPLGFIVNPLVYGYGLPLLFGLVMGSGARLRAKALTLLVGYLAVAAVQVWGVVWESLKTLSFNFGPEVHQVIVAAGISDTLIALCYQLGVLILPPLVPVVLWVLASWEEVEHYIGWRRPGPSG